MLTFDEEQIPQEICSRCFSKRENQSSFFHLCPACEEKVYPETSRCSRCKKEVETENMVPDKSLCLPCGIDLFDDSYDAILNRDIEKYTRMG